MKNLKSSGSIGLRMIAWLLIVSMFFTLMSMADSMTWLQALVAGFSAGAISGILMRLVREAEEDEE